MRLGYKVKRHVTLDPGVVQDLEEIVQRRGGESSLSMELNRAAREYVRRQKGQNDDVLLAPVIDRLLTEKFEQLEAWLRSGVWGGATYSATASLLLLELLCGQKVDPTEARAHLDLVRGRAWKMVRKDGKEEAPGAS